MRQTIVLVLLVILLGVLGISLFLGASNTRDAVKALLASHAPAAASASASASAAPAPSGSAPPSVAASASAGEAKTALNRSLSMVGLGWDLLAPALLAAEGKRSTATCAFAAADVKVSLDVVSTMTEVERALASGGGANGGADLALLPLSELVGAQDRLRALDLRVFLVAGWSQGRDTLSGVALSKLPESGSLGIEYSGGTDAISLALLSLDLSGVSLERVKLDERNPSALLHAKSASIEDTAKQDDLLLTTREASRLLPYVLVAPRPLLEEREVVLAAFVQGFLSGSETLLKDRAKAARTLAALEGAPEALALLQSLGSFEPIRLYDNAELLGLAGRGAVTIESLIDWQFRVRRAAHLGRAGAPEAPLVDGRVVTRLVRERSKLSQPSEPAKRRAAPATAVALLERSFAKEEEDPVLESIGLLAAVFPQFDVRVTLGGKAAKQQGEWLDRAATRYDLDRARLVPGKGPAKPGRFALIEVLRAP